MTLRPSLFPFLSWVLRGRPAPPSWLRDTLHVRQVGADLPVGRAWGVSLRGHGVPLRRRLGWLSGGGGVWRPWPGMGWVVVVSVVVVVFAVAVAVAVLVVVVATVRRVGVLCGMILHTNSSMFYQNGFAALVNLSGACS